MASCSRSAPMVRREHRHFSDFEANMTPQLANAYAAASQVGGFSLALLFDFSATPEFGAQWQDLILPRLQQYATHPAATLYNGAALVSTFVGGSACEELRPS